MAALTSVPVDLSDAPAAATAEASGVATSIRIEGVQPVSIIHLAAVSGEDPSPADLAEIEQEWPLIAAELELLDAEISFIAAGTAASNLDRRRIRRAERRVLAISREFAEGNHWAEVVA
jgi:hypothetical protein